MKVKKYIVAIAAFFAFVLLTKSGFAQIKDNKIQPSTKSPKLKNKILPVGGDNANRQYTNMGPRHAGAFDKYFSLLQYAYFEKTDPDCKSKDCYEWNNSRSFTQNVNDNPATRNWTRNLMWQSIPAGAVYGRWEISLLPFPPGVDESFTGIIRSGLVETKGLDSVYFTLNYIDDANLQRRESRPNTGMQPAGTRPPKSRESNSKIPPVTAKPAIRLNVNSNLLTKMQLQDDGTRKFYIRIVPLDRNKKPLHKISNEVTVQEYRWNPPIPKTEKQNYLASDYTITNVKYVPVHFPDPNLSGCSVVAGYNIEPNNPFEQSFISSFMAAYPIGTSICPQPPKDKAWYEKAFDGVFGFIVKAINGASELYDGIKTYLKNKFLAINCNAGLVTKVINPVTNLQEAAGPKVCELISNAAFEFGMTAVGLPPTLPNVDDFTKMAEGQIVDLACDRIESNTGVPVPEVLREEIKKEFHENLEAATNKGTVNNGFLRVKPHPDAFFRPAHLEIEITRTSDVFKGKAIVALRVSDETTRTIESSGNTGKNVPVQLKHNLFENIKTEIPFIKNVGDKYKIYVVLKPQESHIWKDKNTGIYSHLSSNPQPGYTYTPLEPTYEGNAHTWGFQYLCHGGSVTNFSLSGLNIAEGVTTVFTNN